MSSPDSNLERQIIDDILILGHAVPVEIKGARKSICTVGYSPTKGLVRLYPVPINVRPKRWEVIKVPVERNKQDIRSESWKIQGAQNEWDTLFKKVHHVHEVKGRQRQLNLLHHLLSKYEKDCIHSLNAEKESLGFIRPTEVFPYFEKRENYDPTVQITLDSDVKYKTSSNFELIPKIKYRCSKCKAKNPHDQQLLDRGAYEWIRKNPDNPEQIWKNFRLNDPDYEHYFIVGNQARRLTSFMIITIMWFKKTLL
ncbi:MAG TPA: hypothetical protein VES63_00025 [Candidatus Acidoferrum sp.]|nr:hypothetical protein [Candidatus Acidoferrum sp.]